ncbi:TetR/AcrR family transcriptional regulator [Marinococcus luteus]|uniref:TetR/AcrR family transcriptional regulator n=1 Tax=Marinococcus luteus TaxID=1122204 RepID=UPI002ACCF4FD|nr:TetR/AcrR family transcriptional regulator [Marinococcus luteus]MDZ5783095.1 TetR/AcrR family transcriptional regulator [Marinococcus luteus]
MKAASKKEVILNTAEDLFYQNGFHAVGVKSILNEVGVAPMTMYYHFKSKEVLIIEILKRREIRYFDFIKEKTNGANSFTVYAESLIQAHMDWMKTDGFNGCLFLRAKQEYEGVNEEITTMSKDHKTTLLNKIERETKSFNNSNMLGMKLFMILEGVTSMAQILEMEEIEKSAFNLAKNIQAVNE